MTRKSSMLTPDQRAYLRGEKEYDGQVETNTRYEIRERVKTALLDFGLLFEEMDARDRKQLLRDVRPPSRWDDEDKGLREEEFSGMVAALAFFCLCAEDAGISFENAVEQAIIAAHGVDPEEPFVQRSVGVQDHLDPDVDWLFRKIERGDRLDDVEYYGLARLVVADHETFVRQTLSVDVDVESKLEAGTRLSRGESLVVVGRVYADAARFREYDLFESLHDDVVTDLGLSNAMGPNVGPVL